jgi:hypothetical protein
VPAPGAGTRGGRWRATCPRAATTTQGPGSRSSSRVARSAGASEWSRPARRPYPGASAVVVRATSTVPASRKAHTVGSQDSAPSPRPGTRTNGVERDGWGPGGWGAAVTASAYPRGSECMWFAGRFGVRVCGYGEEEGEGVGGALEGDRPLECTSCEHPRRPWRPRSPR